MSEQSTIRISREIRELQKGNDLSLAVAFNERDIRKVKALIIGPPESPYEFGFFEFKFHFSRDYPLQPPKVTAITTNSGHSRFNPNIYASGKVCLSILGTWEAGRGEEWSTAQGLESIMISIQSLMNSNPWENEPGFDKPRARGDQQSAKMYSQKIHHETIRIAVLQRLEGYLGINASSTNSTPDASEFGSEEPEDDAEEPFIDLCKRRFLWYYEAYQATIAKARREHDTDVKDGTKFKMAPFEGQSNGMNGTFQYTSLSKRLRVVHEKINEETVKWVAEGKAALDRESPDALAMQNKLKSIKLEFKQRGLPVDIDFVDGNPYIWQLVLFGRPMTNLDGGVFRVRICISTKFPLEQPRVNVETPLFHQRVAPDGTLCYFVVKSEELLSHVEGIISAIEEESPAYDPRTNVHPEAAKLLWGSEADKKLYNRKLRRSAQDSTDF